MYKLDQKKENLQYTKIMYWSERMRSRGFTSLTFLVIDQASMLPSICQSHKVWLHIVLAFASTGVGSMRWESFRFYKSSTNLPWIN